uniref:Reverse transcriptase domain-containing protein n=1 Tax=Cannabis sativa TaxID=3483 RepID=A0A803PQU7_CANSA
MSGCEEAFCATFIYGYNNSEERKTLWANLTKLKFPVKLWLILGDFNAVFNIEDRVGGNPITLSDTILQNWKKPMVARGLLAIYLKLMRLKHCLKIFNRDSIGDIGKTYQAAKDDFLEARLLAQAHPKDPTFLEKEKQATVMFLNQEKMYHSFLRQRSKISWLHKAGVIIDYFPKVVDHFVSHFRSYMGSRSLADSKLNLACIDQGPRLDLKQQIDLIQPFTNKEIKHAFFSIPDTKAPGADGFSGGFFKLFWDELGSEFCTAVNDFFATGFMPKELHSTLITLIPKHENPTRAVDYRPIACCTTLYKCISKLLCSRLAKVLPHLINQNQGAFIQGRSIAHNVMILQDLLKNYKRKNVSPRCAIKIDISKAYDTVSWDFMEDLLNAFNIPSRFVKWIMGCLRATSYSLVMNGRVQGGFKGEKGLRQGDPISPLLFVLIMEYLTRSLQLATSHSSFRYHPLCKGLKIINLCFADDLILFSKGSKSSVLVLKQVLEDFSLISGLHINSSKSQIYLGGVKSEEKQAIIDGFHLTEGTFPLKYLGVPLRPSKWKAGDCGIIVDKIKQRLHTWSSRHLSFAGKAQLIHSVLLGLRNYWMSIFVLPHSVTKEVEKLCRDFLWGLNGNRSRIHVASWEKVCLPKAYGGLGFKNGVKWNHSILAKYVWAISTKQDLLWVKWIDNIYLKSGRFWDYDLKSTKR